jgi:phosphoglycolate phosphatase
MAVKPLAIFDLDGTLHRTASALTPAIRQALGDMGRVPPADQEIDRLFGEPMDVICRSLMPGCTTDDCGAFLRALRRRQSVTIPGMSGAYEGITGMLDALIEAGWSTAVCSNAGSDYIELVLGALGLRERIDIVSGAESGRTKAARVCELASGPGTAFAAMIGDRYHDFEAASACGIPSIGCAWGYARPGELDLADAVADHPAEVPGLLEKLFERSPAPG